MLAMCIRGRVEEDMQEPTLTHTVSSNSGDEMKSAQLHLSLRFFLFAATLYIF